MQKQIFLVLFLAIPFCAYGASFDCTKATTKVEKTICENKWLGRLDVDLSYYYKKVMVGLSQSESNNFLSEQRNWIKERNKRCEGSRNTKSCLGSFYRKRVTNLKIRYEEPLLPISQELKNICGEISELTSFQRKKYGDPIKILNSENNTRSYDINNDGINEIAQNCHGGTAHIPCIRFKLPDGTILRTDTINYEWKSYWTYGLKIFNNNGKWYSLHSYDDHFVKPAYVSYLTPENNEYVVCEFDNKEIENFHPNTDLEESSDLCLEVMNTNSTQIRNILLTDEPIISRSDVRDLGRYETGLERQGFLDYNNDGTPNYIGELEYASGAGRGCDYNYFDELAEDRKSFVDNEQRDLLLKMQKVNLDGRHPNCGSSSKGKYMNHFFEFRNKIYFEYKTHSDRAIYKLENNQIYEVCSVKKTYTTSVKSVGIPNK